MEVEVISPLFIHSGALEGALREKEEAIINFKKHAVLQLVYIRAGSVVVS